MPILAAIRRQVIQDARKFCKSPIFDWPINQHNAHLVRARICQGRVVTLLTAYFATGRQQFKKAALEHVEQMGSWEYWSWTAWRKNDARPDADFDLSYGENSMTLAIAYDWLCDELSQAEKELFLAQARDRAFKSFRANAAKAWWFGKADCNWNTVCAGGAGMLALAMWEDIPQSAEVLRLVEIAFPPYMASLEQTGGGWPEGIGYWNYGMRYAFWYLLSHERATGRPHPLMSPPSVSRTLDFPLDFTPGGIPCGFNDVNLWGLLPFHYATAERLGRKDLLAELDRRLEAQGAPPSLATAKQGAHWPDGAEWLAFHSRRPMRPIAPKRRVAKLYEGIGWGVLADQMPEPKLYLSIRGGSTAVSHAHRDLLSFHCVVGGEMLVESINTKEYLDTTFSPRREEIFDISPAAKNTILVNGVGVTAGSSASIEPIELAGGIKGFRLDATDAMGRMRDGNATKFCGRAVLMLKDEGFLIIDRVEMPHCGRVESRMHSFARVRFAAAGAEIICKSQRMQVVYACSVPATLHRAVAAHTTPRPDPAKVLRWCTVGLHHEVVMATLLWPGKDAPAVELASAPAGISALLSGNGRPMVIRLSKTLGR